MTVYSYDLDDYMVMMMKIMTQRLSGDDDYDTNMMRRKMMCYFCYFVIVGDDDDDENDNEGGDDDGQVDIKIYIYYPPIDASAPTFPLTHLREKIPLQNRYYLNVPNYWKWKYKCSFQQIYLRADREGPLRPS